MNWYALVDGRLVYIGRYVDWEAANQATEEKPELWPCAWLASQHDVDQWVQCITETERGQ